MKLWFSFIVYTLIIISHCLLVATAVQNKDQGILDALSVISCILTDVEVLYIVLDFPELTLPG